MAYDNPNELLSLIFLITSVFAAHPPDRTSSTPSSIAPSENNSKPVAPRRSDDKEAAAGSEGMRLGGAEQRGFDSGSCVILIERRRAR